MWVKESIDLYDILNTKRSGFSGLFRCLIRRLNLLGADVVRMECMATCIATISKCGLVIYLG